MLGAMALLAKGDQRRVRRVMRIGLLKSYNDTTRKFAGRRHFPFALLTHEGRRSGQTHQTPLGAITYGDGFVMPLAWGAPSRLGARTFLPLARARSHGKGRPASWNGPRSFPHSMSLECGRHGSGWRCGYWESRICCGCTSESRDLEQRQGMDKRRRLL